VAPFRGILFVKDLASCCPIDHVPVPDRSSGTTVRILNALVQQHGAPLVLKTDLGFCSAELEAFAEAHGIALLHSPPR